MPLSSLWKKISTSTVYMNMLEHLSPHINDNETEEHTTSQQDDRPPRFHIKVLKFVGSFTPCWGMWWLSWLMCCTTRQKVVGSFPDGTTDICQT